jgi:hypothetical protein
MDTVSNGGFLPFAAGAILSPLPGGTGAAIRSVRLRPAANLTAQYVYQLPLAFRNHSSRRR